MEPRPSSTPADTISPGRTRTYTLSAGEMTLVGELIDSESGQVISRFIDRREARNTGTMQLTNSVVDAQEARMQPRDREPSGD